MIIPFYFMLKALIVLEIFAFLSWISGYAEKLFDKKAIVGVDLAMVNFKICHATDWTAIFTIYNLPNISRSKGN